MVKVNKQLKSSMFATAGVLITLLLFIFLAFIVVKAHDAMATSHHENTPTISKEFDWGGLKVKIDIDRKEFSADFLTNAEVQKYKQEYKDNNCDNLGSKANDIKYVSNGLTYGKWCALTKSLANDSENKEMIVVGKIYIKNKTWNKNVEIPYNLLQLNYEPAEPKISKPWEIAQFSSIPWGTTLAARKSISSDIRIQVNLQDDKRTGELVVNDKSINKQLVGYDSIVPIQN